jgi:hypothetical protein
MKTKQLAAKIAAYIFTESSKETTTGNWCVSFKEINSFYDIELEKNQELLAEVENALYTNFGDAILDLEINEEEFDLILGYAYCVNEVDFEEWEDEEDSLPESVQCSVKEFRFETEDELQEQISNFLSNMYGFCVNSYNYKIVEKTIYITNINWDTKE